MRFLVKDKKAEGEGEENLDMSDDLCRTCATELEASREADNGEEGGESESG